jgi:hypothetical protein
MVETLVGKLEDDRWWMESDFNDATNNNIIKDPWGWTIDIETHWETRDAIFWFKDRPTAILIGLKLAEYLRNGR